jgi:16S rRNA (uracil1498-N3)-methyltransferase
MRRRFFVDQFDGDRAVMRGDAAHHLGRVLRAQAGQLYELSDGLMVRLGRITACTRDRVEFELGEQVSADERGVRITLLMSVVKFDAFEWALEKATELGVWQIVPLAAARSEKALLQAAPKRAARWEKILLEAAQQSRRVRLPGLVPLQKPAAAFRGTIEELKLILSERSQALAVRRVLEGAKDRGSVAVVVGPEGGWTDEELAAAETAGFQSVSLGRLILRAETAATAALALVNYAVEAVETHKP